MNTLLKNVGRIYTEVTWIEHGFLLLENGRIKAFGPIEECPVVNDQLKVYDLKNRFIAIPGMIDLHIHGVGGADMMDGTIDALRTITEELPKEGTTSFLPTTITHSKEKIIDSLSNVARYKKSDYQALNCEVLGIHLEGPFLSPTHTGAQPKEHIATPSVELFEEFQNSACGSIKVITLAPELENSLKLIEHASNKGVIVSVGHSNATYDEVQQATQHGLSQATHLFNQMRAMHHREPGVVGAAFLFEEIKTEIIPDGVHVNPQIVKLAYKQIGHDRMLLITDSIRAKGLQDGQYELGGQSVEVISNKVTLPDGTLAGSTLRMIDGFKNFIQFTGCTIADAIKVTSHNPAKQLNVFDRKGSISIGKDADIVILNNQYDVHMTFCRGNLSYSREEEEK